MPLVARVSGQIQNGLATKLREINTFFSVPHLPVAPVLLHEIVGSTKMSVGGATKERRIRPRHFTNIPNRPRRFR